MRREGTPGTALPLCFLRLDGDCDLVCGIAGSEAGEHPGTVIKEAGKVANSPWLPWGAAERLVSGMRSIIP